MKRIISGVGAIALILTAAPVAAQIDPSISGLPMASVPAGTDIVPCIQGGQRKACTVAQLKTAARTAPLKIALLGHSFTVQAYASATSDAPRGIAYWTGLLSHQRLQFDFSRVFGLAGDTSGYSAVSRPGFLSRLPAVLASDADVVIVSDPTNDFAAGVPFADTSANMATIFTSIRNAGKIAVTWAPTPRGAPNGLTADGLLLQARYASWLKVNAKALGVAIADASATLANPSADGFDSAAGMMVADDLHLAINGARALGQSLVTAATPSLVPLDLLSYSAADVYDPAKNPGGNLLANAVMRGTGGTMTAGGSTISGQVADGWQVLVANGAGLTVSCSVVTVGNRRMQQVSVSGTPTAGNPAVWVRQSPAYSGQLSAGDNLQAMGYVEVDAGSSGVTGIGIQQWTTDSSGGHAMRTGDSVGSVTNGTFPAEAFAGVARTAANATAATPTGFYAQFGAAGVNNVAMSITMRWSNLEIRKLP